MLLFRDDQAWFEITLGKIGERLHDLKEWSVLFEKDELLSQSCSVRGG